jgi:FkbM family methyltransferase
VLGALPARIKRRLPPRLRVPAIALKHYWLGESELRILGELAARRRGAVDVGANQGAYTWLLAQLCPRVWAFEPHPELAAILRGWAPRHVEIHECVLSDRAGETELVVPCFRGRPEPGQASAAPWAWVRELPVQQRYRCQAARLDDIVDEDIGFIKIDVEGLERQVIEGSLGLLQRSQPVLLVEIEQRHQPRPVGELFGLLAGLGYAASYFWRGNHFDVDWARLTGDPSAPAPWPAQVRNFIFRSRS